MKKPALSLTEIILSFLLSYYVVIVIQENLHFHTDLLFSGFAQMALELSAVPALFAFLTFCIAGLMPTKKPTYRNLTWVAAISLVFGAYQYWLHFRPVYSTYAAVADQTRITPNAYLILQSIIFALIIPQAWAWRKLYVSKVLFALRFESIKEFQKKYIIAPLGILLVTIPLLMGLSFALNFERKPGFEIYGYIKAFFLLFLMHYFFIFGAYIQGKLTGSQP